MKTRNLLWLLLALVSPLGANYYPDQMQLIGAIDRDDTATACSIIGYLPTEVLDTPLTLRMPMLFGLGVWEQNTPLQYAVAKDRLEIAGALLLKGASPNALTARESFCSWLSVNHCALAMARSPGMVDMLLEHGADPNQICCSVDNKKVHEHYLYSLCVTNEPKYLVMTRKLLGCPRTTERTKAVIREELRKLHITRVD